MKEQTGCWSLGAALSVSMFESIYPVTIEPDVTSAAASGV